MMRDEFVRQRGLFKSLTLSSTNKLDGSGYNEEEIGIKSFREQILSAPIVATPGY